MIIWAHNAGSRETPTEAGQSADPIAPYGASSEDSDTDSEEEGSDGVHGFSQNVEVEWYFG